MSVIFDRLSFARKLEGEQLFSRPQAERLSEAFHDAVQEAVATKSDIERLRTNLERLEFRLAGDLLKLDTRLTSEVAKLTAEFAKVEAKFDRAKIEIIVAFGGIAVVVMTIARLLFR